jgi:hypothetical protein
VADVSGESAGLAQDNGRKRGERAPNGGEIRLEMDSAIAGLVPSSHPICIFIVRLLSVASTSITYAACRSGQPPDAPVAKITESTIQVYAPYMTWMYPKVGEAGCCPDITGPDVHLDPI